MHVSKLPPSALPTSTPPETAPSKQNLASEIVTAITQDLQELERAAPAAPASDHADIRPLEVSGGLQVMLAEFRSAFELIAESIGTAAMSNVALDESGKSSVEVPAQAARQIVEWVLQAMPEDASNPVVWSAVLVRVETALQGGLQQAESALANWREVPPSVLDAVKQAGGVALQVLSDERPNPLWLRPEWVGLEPRLERFWRRRRAARRHLTDPDLWQWNLDDPDEQKR
jgi:hypothetical protein